MANIGEIAAQEGVSPDEIQVLFEGDVPEGDWIVHKVEYSITKKAWVRLVNDFLTAHGVSDAAAVRMFLDELRRQDAPESTSVPGIVRRLCEVMSRSLRAVENRGLPLSAPDVGSVLAERCLIAGGVGYRLKWTRGSQRVFETDGNQLVASHDALQHFRSAFAFEKNHHVYEEEEWQAHDIAECQDLNRLGIRNRFPDDGECPCVLLPKLGHERINSVQRTEVQVGSYPTAAEVLASYRKAYEVLDDYCGGGSARVRKELLQLAVAIFAYGGISFTSSAKASSATSSATASRAKPPESPPSLTRGRTPSHEERNAKTSPSSINITVPGRWMTRLLNDGETSWDGWNYTPGTIEIEPGHVYMLRIVTSDKDNDISGVDNLRGFTALRSLDLSHGLYLRFIRRKRPGY